MPWMGTTLSMLIRTTPVIATVLVASTMVTMVIRVAFAAVSVANDSKLWMSRIKMPINDDWTVF